jgi:hypothetical protein
VEHGFWTSQKTGLYPKKWDPDEFGNSISNGTKNWEVEVSSNGAIPASWRDI